MNFYQKTINISSDGRGFHLITDRIYSAVPEICKYREGLFHLFIQHTSASITLNENTDPSVRNDLELSLNDIVPEDKSYYTHILEGPDDMPAHIKHSLIGSSLSIPISEGKLLLGTWQGIYLCEHRNSVKERNLVITIIGDSVD